MIGLTVAVVYIYLRQKYCSRNKNETEDRLNETEDEELSRPRLSAENSAHVRQAIADILSRAADRANLMREYERRMKFIQDGERFLEETFRKVAEEASGIRENDNVRTLEEASGIRENDNVRTLEEASGIRENDNVRILEEASGIQKNDNVMILQEASGIRENDNVRILEEASGIRENDNVRTLEEASGIRENDNVRILEEASGNRENDNVRIPENASAILEEATQKVSDELGKTQDETDDQDHPMADPECFLEEASRKAAEEASGIREDDNVKITEDAFDILEETTQKVSGELGKAQDETDDQDHPMTDPEASPHAEPEAPGRSPLPTKAKKKGFGRVRSLLQCFVPKRHRYCKDIPYKRHKTKK